MHTEKQFPNTLEDNIRTRGAMEKLISDSAQVEKSVRVKDILRSFTIQDWQSEAYMQHQNYAERRWQTVKTTTNTLQALPTIHGYSPPNTYALSSTTLPLLPSIGVHLWRLLQVPHLT